MEPPKDTYDVCLKGGNMCLNRFCIDEDAAFELSEVCYLERSSVILWDKRFQSERKLKGKGLESNR